MTPVRVTMPPPTLSLKTRDPRVVASESTPDKVAELPAASMVFVLDASTAISAL